MANVSVLMADGIRSVLAISVAHRSSGFTDRLSPQVLRDQRQLAAVFGVSDAGDGVPRADFFCDQAAQQIQFVRHRHRNQQIRRIDAGFHLRCIGCTVSLDAKNVQVLARLLQGLAAAVDDRNLMSLARELFRECSFRSFRHQQ